MGLKDRFAGQGVMKTNSKIPWQCNPPVFYKSCRRGWKAAYNACLAKAKTGETK